MVNLDQVNSQQNPEMLKLHNTGELLQKNPKLAMRQFSDDKKNAKEYIRTLKERAKFLHQKFKAIHDKKNRLEGELKKEFLKLDYENANKAELEYLAILEKQELPAMRIYSNMITNHVFNYRSAISHVKIYFEDVEKTIYYFEKIQGALKDIIQTIEDEIVQLRECIEKGLPLYLVVKLNKAEKTENALEKHLTDIGHEFRGWAHRKEAKYSNEILKIQKNMKKVKVLRKAGNTLHEYVEGVDKLEKIVFVAEGIAAVGILFAPAIALPTLAGLHLFKTLLHASSVIAEAEEIAESLSTAAEEQLQDMSSYSPT